MGRIPTLTYDRGTLILHPPPRGKSWVDLAHWDDRIEKFRIPAQQYRTLVENLRAENITFQDQVQAFQPLDLSPKVTLPPYPDQQEALQAWVDHRWRGVVVLPTAAGNTYLAQLAMQTIPRSTLITVPTLDLMHQWYAHAEYSIAPYRLGLTATPDRVDGRHHDLTQLLGPTVYQKSAADLSGDALASFQIVPMTVKLSNQERARYDQLIAQRNRFSQEANIWLSSAQGWRQFVRASAQSQGGRRAMLAHREAKTIALGTGGKLRVLEDLLAQHYPDRTIIFTNDNATVYRISETFLIPAITHQTPVKERHTILQAFRKGEYPALVVSHVLNEGVDVPEARIAILLSGTGSTREYVQRLGRILRRGSGDKQAILYEVVAEATTEEGIAHRRRQEVQPHRPRQLELVPAKPVYDDQAMPLPKVADPGLDATYSGSPPPEAQRGGRDSN